MKEKEFLEKMVDLMDTEEELALDTVLAEIDEWDSLSTVAFLSMCTKFAKTKVDAPEVRAAKTLHDLYDLLMRE